MYVDVKAMIGRSDDMSMITGAAQPASLSATCIPQLVAKWAAAAPDAVAIVADGQALSYRELNRRANQLAHYLQALGVRPDTLVGLCVERSLDMVVGLLGILKAGGAYVPLDPGYPEERLAFMLRDARAPVLLTQQKLAERLSEQAAQVICLDADAELLGRQRADEPAIAATAANLAYVIYTSGSTGQPKGVQITHGSLLNLVCWHQDTFAVTAADRATQLASPAFDATGWELWPYLSAGASVYLPDEQTRVTPHLLRDWLLEQQITMTFLPTLLAEQVMALEWPRTSSLRFLLTGADKLQRYPAPGLPFVVVNNYGPTEATVVATSGLVPPLAHPDGPPSIGRPIANTEVYLLDERLQPVPAGMPGELYIGGAGLAVGYLNRPELTAEKFICHPFSSEPGARLYRTGDLARWLPDGQLAFLGRVDHQIKIRGYRIEPNEIVAALNRHPAVQNSYVLAREDTPGDKRLVAYVVLASTETVSAGALRAALAAHLPDYMIPAVFVRLDALPLTPNGKVDRAALPQPGVANTLRDGALTAPSTPIEARIVEIVAKLVGLDQVGVDENFFELGAHSLLGAQVVVQVNEAFGVELSLRDLFAAPTARRLAAEVERLILATLEAMSEEEARRLLL